MTTTEKEALKIAVQVSVTWQRISDLLCTGLEGGYSPWLHTFKRHGLGLPQAKESPWYCDPDMLADPLTRIYIAYDRAEDAEGAGKGRMIADSRNLVRAVETMANKYPVSFANFHVENEDALTGDVFLQCLVFGECIYG